jgi:hypothetical protein
VLEREHTLHSLVYRERQRRRMHGTPQFRIGGAVNIAFAC